MNESCARIVHVTSTCGNEPDLSMVCLCFYIHAVYVCYHTITCINLWDDIVVLEVFVYE